MNQFNVIHGDEPKEPPRECNSQPLEAHFESRTSPSRTNPVISDVMGKLNHHAIDSCDVKIPTPEFPVDNNSESVPDPDTTLIKSIDDDEMDHLLEFFHLEHDDDLLSVDLRMLQA